MLRLAVIGLCLASPAARATDGGVPLETTVSEPRAAVPEERAGSTVRRGEFERRLPRSTPDALRYEPGVFIQQTAHGQASAFLRGLTGQQTVLLFDGIRLNTSTWRQGPNQYAFTLDAASLASLEVLRSGGSTRFGSDALGGVIAAQPLEAPRADDGAFLRPSAWLKGTSADDERGGRLSLEGAAGPVGFVGGVGLREVGLLESAGPVRGVDGEASVPRFAPDGRTQLGTGFKELTADGRVSWRPGARHELTLASQAYRQFDAPRTDQCPPPFARSDECLTYLEQFRTLTYLSYRFRPEALDELRATLSWQRQHEVREGARPASFVRNLGRDTVDTLGATLTVAARPLVLREGLRLRLAGGLDSYLDLVDSSAFTTFTDVQVTRQLSRGQYLAGSTSLTGGLFADALLAVSDAWELRAGGRVGWASLQAPADERSGTVAVRSAWAPLAAHAGVAWRPLPVLEVLANVDRSFRAPNLDDLTSRQQTGPGFQFENPSLQPEGASTVEAGLRLRHAAVSAEAWAFQTWLSGAVVKQPRDLGGCPAATPQCQASWFRFQLVNAPGVAHLRGGELSLRARLPWGLGLRGTAAYAWGESPGVVDGAPVPLTRVPPLNGTAELSWRHELGFGFAGAVRWAGEQRRLAVADLSDARIPLGGTPGWAVVDLRAWLRLGPLAISVVLENLLDTPWRAHGSSVNGPGRGLLVLIGFALPARTPESPEP